MFFHAFIHAEEKRNKHEIHEQEIVTLRNTAEEELTNVKERLEEALEQKIRMENLYSELENKYMLLQREFDQYVLDSKSKISQLEHKNQDEETRSINLAKELEVMREQYSIEKQQSMHALELLRKNLLEHIRDLGLWKSLNSGQDISIDMISARVENEIQNLSPDDQISLLAQQLEREDKEILELWNQRASNKTESQ